MLVQHLASLLMVAAGVSGDGRRPRWAAAVLLTTQPSGKSDGWTARSVKKRSGACPSGPTLCAVFVLKSTFARYSELSSEEADFTALVDSPVSPELRASLEANGVVPVEMDLPQVFHDYLLMRKFYVLKMDSYEKVLLLDSDTIVVGSLRHLFVGSAVCGRDLAENRCWQETRDDSPCLPSGKAGLVVAQQTPGTPILTAFMLVRPGREAWRALAAELEALCGGRTVCNRKFIYSRGWNGTMLTRDWALRLGRSAVSRRKRSNHRDRAWSAMGAGFTDQGFAEYYFGQHLRSLYSISHRTCKLHYIHFNMPPKPWFCPGKPHCDPNDFPRHTEGDLRWGGHKCSKDWWWQFVKAAPEIKAPPGSCAASCLANLRSAQNARASFSDPAMANYTPVCKDWNPQWPPLRPRNRHRPPLVTISEI